MNNRRHTHRWGRPFRSPSTGLWVRLCTVADCTALNVTAPRRSTFGQR